MLVTLSENAPLVGVHSQTPLGLRSEALSELRELLNLSRQQLAKRLGAARGAVWCWEQGYNCPEPHFQERIRRLLDLHGYLGSFARLYAYYDERDIDGTPAFASYQSKRRASWLKAVGRATELTAQSHTEVSHQADAATATSNLASATAGAD